jgi:hypothetical protein
LLLFALVAACTSGPSKSLRIMYNASLRERLDDGKFSSLGERYASRQRDRVQAVRKLVMAEELITAEDYLYAGVILSTSTVEDDLIAASASGIKATELGDPRGMHVAAEALDRLLMHRGKPQRYGTQYYYIEVIQKWRLYPVDPATTDSDRAAVGVAPMSDLKAREAELNAELR